MAIERGFRGIDTAGQPKHYHEAGVGAAVPHVLMPGYAARIYICRRNSPRCPATTLHSSLMTHRHRSASR